MNSLGLINLAVAFFLFAVIHEGSTEPSNWLKIIFRARQAEARRNRIKYKDENVSKKTVLYASFLLDGQIVNGFRDFVMPELSDDGKLDQKFERTDNEFFLMCRKRDKPETWISRQKTALDYLKEGRGFFYSAADRGIRRDGIFTLIPTPLSEYEKVYYKEKNETKHYLCSNVPMPGIFAHMTTIKSTFGKNVEKVVTYQYGEGGTATCGYLEFGIESVPYDQDGREALRDRLAKGAWAQMYNICHDVDNSVTGFTRHTIYSGYITQRKLNFNLDFSRFEETYLKGLEKFYNLENQLRSFQSNPIVFKKELKAFNMESNYLVRTRLIPEFDVLSESWQHGINNTLNYAPMWRSVNMGQWLKVEQDIRHMAYKFDKARLTVYTGVYYKKDSPRLYFIDDNVRDQPSTSKKKNASIYKSIPIPTAFYKYVHSEVAGIVLITANGVSGSLKDIECDNVCDQFGWHFTENTFKYRNDEQFGTTKCCRPKDFFSQEKFKYFIPNPPSHKKSPITKILTAGGLELNPTQQLQTEVVQYGQYSEQDEVTMGFGAERPVAAQSTSYLIGGDLSP